MVRGREEEGVKVYGYGKQAYELLLGYILDPEYGDITDINEGTDIALTYTKPNKPGWNQQKMTRGEHRQSLMNRTAIFKRENTLKVLTSYVDPDQSKGSDTESLKHTGHGSNTQGSSLMSEIIQHEILDGRMRN